MTPDTPKKRSSWLQAIFEMVDKAPIGPDEKERLRHFTVFVVLGIPTLAAFAAYHIIHGRYLLVAMLVATCAGIALAWFRLNQLQDGQVVYRIVTAWYFVLVMYLVTSTAQDGSRILWIFTFPLIVLFLIGPKEGLFGVGFLYIVVALILWVPIAWLKIYPFEIKFKVRFLASFAIVTVITYWFEHFRHRYRTGMHQKQEQLEYEKQRLRKEIAERKKTQKEKEELIVELQASLEKINTLGGLIPICANCHSIRDDQGYWNHLEDYIQKHVDAEFSHGICPKCEKELYPDLFSEE